jgi:hypothetical protein
LNALSLNTRLVSLHIFESIPWNLDVYRKTIELSKQCKLIVKRNLAASRQELTKILRILALSRLNDANTAEHGKISSIPFSQMLKLFDPESFTMSSDELADFISTIFSNQNILTEVMKENGVLGIAVKDAFTPWQLKDGERFRLFNAGMQTVPAQPQAKAAAPNNSPSPFK